MPIYWKIRRSVMKKKVLGSMKKRIDGLSKEKEKELKAKVDKFVDEISDSLEAKDKE